MNIKREHFIDTAAKDADDNYKYYYEGDHYEITFPDVIYHARSYVDTPTELTVSSQVVAGRQTLFKSIPYNDAQFHECIRHFRDQLKFKEFKVLIEKESIYKSVDLEKFV